MNSKQNLKTVYMSNVFLARTDCFGQLGINDSHINLNNDHKGPDNIKFTNGKCNETFYGRRKALTLAIRSINRF